VVGIDISWSGSGIDEVGVDGKTGRELIAIDPRYFRHAEVGSLLGDATKAREKLHWRPRCTFGELVREMVTEDVKLAARES
jgi:GDPmannose 4,6-dehydratase